MSFWGPALSRCLLARPWTAPPLAWGRVALGLASGAVGALAWGVAPAAAAGDLPCRAGELVGGLNPYEVRRGDTVPWLGVRFGVHPIRITRPNQLRGYRLVRGSTIVVDQRRVLPRFDASWSGVVLNLPDTSVYFVEGGEVVREYPVAVSAPTRRTPIGQTRVVLKERFPTWYVPKSIQREMAARGLAVRTAVPPGPNNPLGVRWLGFWDGSYGMHGTTSPTSIKHYASHGCVRFRAADIIDLYDRVRVGTPVRVVYQPVLMGKAGDGVWMTATSDYYGRGFDYRGAARQLASQLGVAGQLRWDRVEQAIRARDGVPVLVAGVAAGPSPSPSPSAEASPSARPTRAPRPTPEVSSPSPTPTPVLLPPSPEPTLEPGLNPFAKPSAAPASAEPQPAATGSVRPAGTP